jgi:hypothetical protein
MSCPSFPSFSGKIMSFKYCLFLALVPCVAQAQQIDPADAQARVPALPHVSAFKDYRSTAAPTTTPDLTWRVANAKVASEAGGGMHTGRHQQPDQQPAVDAPARVDSHADHANHAHHAAPAVPADHSRHEGHQ